MGGTVSLDQAKNETLQRDVFGKRKLIVFGTRTGMVEAIDTLSGETVWSRYYGNMGALSKVVLMRSTLVKYPAILGLIFYDHKGIETIALAIDSFTGSPVEEMDVQRYPFIAKKVVELPFEEPQHRVNVLGFVSPQNKVGCPLHFMSALFVPVDIFFFSSTGTEIGHWSSRWLLCFRRHWTGFYTRICSLWKRNRGNTYNH
jgi:hypothetical protein